MPLVGEWIMHLVWMMMLTMLPVASITDAIMQFGMVLLLLAVGMAGVIIWLMIRQWGPALRQISTIIDREMHQAEQSAEGLQQHAQAQMKRVYRQAASVRSALDGVKSLHSLTGELEQRAHDLRQLAHHMAAESSMHGTPADDFTRYAISSAEQLAETAERAKHTYRKLLTSVNQLVTDGDSLREGEEMERQARELTGAVERVRLAVHDRHILAPNGQPKSQVTRGTGQSSGGRRIASRDSWPGRAEQRARVAESAAPREDSARQRGHTHPRDDREVPYDRPARGLRAEAPMLDERAPPGAGRLTRNRNAPRDDYVGSPPAPERDREARGRPTPRPTHARERDDAPWPDDGRRDDERRPRSTSRRPFADDEREWRR